MMRISLLAGDLRNMHKTTTGALLSGAASVRMFQLIASVLTLLFTTSSVVRPLTIYATSMASVESLP